MKRFTLINGLAVTLLSGLFLMPGIASARGTDLRNADFLEVNSVKYRRIGAESALLGAIGVRRERVGNPRTPNFERTDFLVASTGEVNENTDRLGSDYRNFVTGSSSNCQEACNTERRCKAWTFVKANTFQGLDAHCYLKDAVPEKRYNEHCISGLPKRIDIKLDTLVTITTQQRDQLGAVAAASLIGDLVGGSADGETTTERNATYALAKYSFPNEQQVIHELNALSESKRKGIKKSGNERIVTSVFILLSGSETQINNYRAEAEGHYQDAQISASGGLIVTHSGESSFTFSAGTVIAYEYDKIKWKSAIGKNRFDVVDLKTDRVDF